MCDKHKITHGLFSENCLKYGKLDMKMKEEKNE